MPVNTQTFLQELVLKLNAFDQKAATEWCAAFTAFLYSQPDPFPVKEAEMALQHLRNKRMFTAMQQVADALIQTGRHSFRIRRQYAQSLIDTGNYTAALCILDALSNEVKSSADKTAAKEYREAQGLTGRVYKQLYVQANNAANPRNIEFLTRAVQAYNNIYTEATQTYLWHGINVVALLYRAKADGIALQGLPDSEPLAQEILNIVEEKYADPDERADAWDFAIAAEACIALNRTEEAVEWLSGYFRDPYVDAFELASTLRQMEEVWKLTLQTETGRLILPLMRAQLLLREGGNVLIDPKELKQQQDADKNTAAVYEKLMQKPAGGSDQNKGLEKVFGPDSYNTYRWMMTANERGQAVARIGRDASKGFGTGFILPGKQLHEKLADELVLVTNAHVVSEDGSRKSLTPYEAIVIFEALDSREEFRVDSIIWSSPADALDTTILRFRADHTDRLKALTRQVNLYPVAPALPPRAEEPSTAQRIYIIGHPAGGTLQYSLQDNMLLDYDEAKIHYRTPTIGGSSGSPVFNEQWDLIGLHHAGRTDMAMLNGKQGTYEANEGLWIQAIRNKLNEHFTAATQQAVAE